MLSWAHTKGMLLQQTGQTPLDSPEGSEAPQNASNRVLSPAPRPTPASASAYSSSQEPNPSSVLSPKKQKTDGGHAVSLRFVRVMNAVVLCVVGWLFQKVHHARRTQFIAHDHVASSRVA